MAETLGESEERSKFFNAFIVLESKLIRAGRDFLLSISLVVAQS